MKTFLAQEHAGTRVSDFILGRLVENADGHGVTDEAPDVGFGDIALRG